MRLLVTLVLAAALSGPAFADLHGHGGHHGGFHGGHHGGFHGGHHGGFHGGQHGGFHGGHHGGFHGGHHGGFHGGHEFYGHHHFGYSRYSYRAYPEYHYVQRYRYYDRHAYDCDSGGYGYPYSEYVRPYVALAPIYSRYGASLTLVDDVIEREPAEKTGVSDGDGLPLPRSARVGSRFLTALG